MTTSSDLICPWCAHDMTSLQSNRCPECGKQFVLAKPNVITKAKSSLRVAIKAGTEAMASQLPSVFAA